MSNNTSTPATTATFPTVEAYVAADVTGKAAIRRDTDLAMKAAIKAGDLPAAQAAMTALANYKAAGSAPKADVFDWNGAIANRIAVLRHAADLLESGTVTPDGTPDGFSFTEPVGPTNTDLDAATGLAKAGIRRSAKRDLNALLVSVFAGIESGTTVKVGDLVKAVAAIGEGYVPSPGAVSAALASKKGISGVTFIPANKAKGVKAAGRKA